MAKMSSYLYFQLNQTRFHGEDDEGKDLLIETAQNLGIGYISAFIMFSAVRRRYMKGLIDIHVSVSSHQNHSVPFDLDDF